MAEEAPAYRLNPQVRRRGGGRILVGGSPPRLLRLSADGAGALDQILRGAPLPRAAGLVRRLLAHGMLDPVARPAAAEVTFVVPARDGGPALAALVAGLLPHGPVIVVDDASRDGSAGPARDAGATVVTNREEAGPGGARNTGWRLAETEFVAFIDADCRVAGDWARPLAGLLAADPSLALVAPRVRGTGGAGPLARWDLLHSPLDLGPAGGLVGPGRPLAFVPSAALVARRAALVELDGFAAELRFGEDVDLAWRAVAAGWRVRYAPEIEVRHPPRATLAGRARQHFDYGTSAAALERRHPGAAVPLRPSRMVLPAALLAAGSPGGAVLAAAAVAAVAGSRHSEADARLAVARLALDGELRAGRELARALAREWLPAALAAALLSRRARRLALAALGVDLVAATGRHPSPGNCLLRLADNAAYGAGVWRGAAAERSVAALVPPLRWRAPGSRRW